MPGINPIVVDQLVQRAGQGDPSAADILQQLGYGPDGQPLPPTPGPPGGVPGGPPGGPGMAPMGGGMPPPGGGGMPPGGGGPPMDPRMMQATQMAQGLRGGGM